MDAGESARRFLASLRRDSPPASSCDSGPNHGLQISGFAHDAQVSHNTGRRQSSPDFQTTQPTDPLFDPPSPPDFDRPLDEFDKQLLQERSSGDRIILQQRPTRIALPPRPQTPLMTKGPRNILQDNLHINTMRRPSCSSPEVLATSPTIAALQNRRHDRVALRRRMSANSKLQISVHDGARAASTTTLPYQKPTRKGSLDHAPPIVQGIQLVPAAALPDQLRSVFKFEIFNAVQSKCFASAFKSDDNLVVSAPTGSGKTVIMELAMCRLIAESQGQDFKVVYLAPTKSLCSERYRDWQTKFGLLNLRCAELTGDTDYIHLRNVQIANIIITTPEKWDSVTRKWKDHAKLLQLVKLFLVDEVHILKDWRGATLEAVVSRMKSVCSNIRFVALSATVPNSEDVAIWLGKNYTSPYLPAQKEVFGESFRPVQLRKHVYGFEARGSDFAFESMLTQKIPDVITQHGQGKPIMIFCSTRRASVNTAKALAEMWSRRHPLQPPWKGPDKTLSLSNPELSAAVVAGVAFHHGGLSTADRRAIEQGFLDGQIKIICSTSTLAVGVNLPCYLVILKGTTAWSDNGFHEYADLEVMQMLGRAGRPQFETSACAVILTRKEKAPRYEKMVSGEEVLESCLHQNLIEHLNAEISLGTVDNLESAKQWLASTFLYVRLGKNPSHYRFREGVDDNFDGNLLEQLCRKDITLLQDAELIKQEARLVSTEFGQAMARYYVTFDTMKSFIGLPPKAKMSEILSVLAQARELREVRMSAGEKSFYKEINKAPEIKFPIKVDVALPAHKVSLLIQAELGNVAIPDGENYKKHHQQHRIDKLTVFAHAHRLIRCIIDCQIHLEDAISTRHALELGRSLAAHVWDNTASQLRQIDGLGEVAVRKLASATISSIDTLLNTEPARIELVLGKNPPFGYQLLKKLESFPNLRVSVKETGREIRVGKSVTIKFVAEIGFLNEVAPQFFKKRQIFVCFVAETSDGKLVDFRRFGAKNLQKGAEVFISLQLTKPTSHVNCYVMCDEVAGTSKYAELPLSNIPDTLYPSSRLRESTNDGTSQILGTFTPWDEEFDDGGINDQDLLSIEADEAKIEIIEDIDDILDADDGKRHRKSWKRTPGTDAEAKHDHDEDADITVYREPTQLANGRWTCQHDCNERHKKCKHKCCREGVAKPRRRPKAESRTKEEDKTQIKLTALTTTKVKRGAETEINGKDRSQTKPTAACTTNLTTNGEQDGKCNRKSNNAIQGGDSDTTFFNHEKQCNQTARKRPRLSKNRGSDRLQAPDPDGNISSENLEGSMTEVSPFPREGAAPNLENIQDGFFSPAFGDDKRFGFSNEETPPIDGNEHISSKIVSFEEDMNPVDPEEQTAIDMVYPNFATSDVDLGGFEPPVEHVAMSDLHKKSISFASDRRNTTIQDSLNVLDAMDLGGDSSGGHVSCGDFTMDEAEQLDPADVQSLQNIGAINSYADTLADSAMETPGLVEMQGTTNATKLTSANEPSRETEWEREKRLYEEDQRKKWEGIDPWIYDEFHKYVELI